MYNRIVTLAVPPYRIIYANGAYSALTGVPSHETLGKTLYDLVVKPKTLSLDACAATSSEGQYTSIDLALDDLKDLRMKVTPIVSRTQNGSSSSSSSTGGGATKVTHFVVHLTDPTDHGRGQFPARVAIPIRVTA